MNREQRRAAAKQSRRAKPAKTIWQQAEEKAYQSLKAQMLLESVRPFDLHETSTILIKTHMALDRIESGEADADDFHLLMDGMNIAKARALEAKSDLADVFARAQLGLTATRERWERTGRWGFDGPSLHALRLALPIHEQILNASSPLQIEIAQAAATASILKNAQRKREAACSKI